MSDHHKYLVTTENGTGEIVRVELLGAAGELVEVPRSRLELTAIQVRREARESLRGIPTPPVPFGATRQASSHPSE